MFRGKLGVKNATSNFMVYSPVGLDNFTDFTNRDLITVSIDIAIKNFALCIEKRHVSGKIENLVFDRIDFTKIGGNTQKKSGTTAVDPEIINSSLDYLLTKSELLKQADIVCIERQMAENYKCSRMFQHTLSVFLMLGKLGKLKEGCIVMDINPKVKGAQLNMPKKLTYHERKGWAIEKAREILTERGDEETLQVMLKCKGKSKYKGDDLADTICQMEAWFKLIDSE